MVFTKDSGLVKVWVSLVFVGVYKVEQVPALFNLRQVVTDVVNGVTE
ncbi:hypothetical protein [Bacillus sp. Hm123]